MDKTSSHLIEKEGVGRKKNYNIGRVMMIKVNLLYICKKNCFQRVIDNFSSNQVHQKYIQVHHLESLKTYIKSCVSILWLINNCNPPLYITTEFNEFNKKLHSKFLGKGTCIDYYIWPCLFTSKEECDNNSPAFAKGDVCLVEHPQQIQLKLEARKLEVQHSSGDDQRNRNKRDVITKVTTKANILPPLQNVYKQQNDSVITESFDVIKNDEIPMDVDPDHPVQVPSKRDGLVNHKQQNQVNRITRI